MADQLANNAKGRFAQWVQNVLDNAPANSAVEFVALKAAQADDDLRGYDDLAALLANAGNTECDFTNYARVVFTDVDAITRTVDDVNDRVDCDFPDWTYTSAGGTLDNNIVKVVGCYDGDTTGGTDSDVLVIGHHDFVQATNGGDISAQVAASGLYRAA